MHRMQARRVNEGWRLLLVVVAAIATLACPAAAQLQDVQHRLPALQAPASDNLESEMMNRLAVTGQLEPGDLSRLARLAVLNSISMLVNVRADLAESLLGNRLEQELTELWNSSEAFYEDVSSLPLDATNLAQAQYHLEAMAEGQRRVNTSLGGLPGISQRAANNFQAFSRLLGPIGSGVNSLEANLAGRAGQVAPRSLDLEPLRQQAQLIANDLVTLIAKAGEVGRGRPGRDAIVTELTELLERVQSFSRLLPIQPSLRAVQDSFRRVRRQMWHVEGRISQLDWKAGLVRPWLLVKNHVSAVSDQLGLPRVIALEPPARPLTGIERSIAAHVDHAVAWLDEFLAQTERSLRKTEAGTQFRADATRLRRELLSLRRRAIAGEPAARLAEPLKVIERSNRQLSDRAAAMASDDTGKSLDSIYRNAAEAVGKLVALAPKE